MIVRIDDHPAGIRPIQPGQLDTFDLMLNEFERYGIQVHLGIVPITYLREAHKLKQSNIVACCHGYDHDYALKSAQLKNDPFNKSTFGEFDEFAQISRHKIKDRLITGKVILEREFGPIDTYIPVCNQINEELAVMLEEVGYRRILCENVVKSPIPILKSDFYGKLEDYDFGKHEIITLHMAWEWDTIQEKGFEYWAGLIRKLSGRSEAKPKKPYRILFKFPIRGRREKFFKTLDRYYAMIVDKTNFEFLITIDRDDPVMNNQSVWEVLDIYKNLSYEISDCKSKIEAVNYGIEKRAFDIVFIVSDDMIPQVQAFDNEIRRRMYDNFPDTDGCLWFNDGTTKDKLNSLQIMGRKWFDRWGYVYNPEYISQHCDYEYQIIAQKWGKIKYFPECIVRHEHPDFGFVPYDALVLKNYTFCKRDHEKFNEREKRGFPVGIPKIAHFIWSKGTKLNYLRYLTYKTFKQHNPDWKVMFHLVEGCSKEKTWIGPEKQEFLTNPGKDYLPKIDKSEIVIHQVENIPPHQTSDLVRMQVLYYFGGFYLDFDQIILKSFNELTDYDVVWGGSRINYSGVLGMFRRCPLAKELIKLVRDKIESNPQYYCEAGNWLWSDFISNTDQAKYYKLFCTPMNFFYPVEESYMMAYYYHGKRPDLSNSYALHWFGGHLDSQEFLKLPESEINETLKSWGIEL